MSVMSRRVHERELITQIKLVPIADNRMRDYLIKRKRIDRFYKIVARSACYELIYELIRENLCRSRVAG